MTTIATDGKSIAGDGRAMRGWERMSDTIQKVHVHRGRVFGFSGQEGLMRVAIEWFERGANPLYPPKANDNQSWALVVFVALDEASIYSDENLYGDTIELPFALGNGREYARGAMLAGASPKRAVEIAAMCDAATGGTITVIDIAAALGDSALQDAAE